MATASSKSGWTLDTRVTLAPDADSRLFRRESDGKLFVINTVPRTTNRKTELAVVMLRAGCTISETAAKSGLLRGTIAKMFNGVLTGAK